MRSDQAISEAITRLRQNLRRAGRIVPAREWRRGADRCPECRRWTCPVPFGSTHEDYELFVNLMRADGADEELAWLDRRALALMGRSSEPRRRYSPEFGWQVWLGTMWRRSIRGRHGRPDLKSAALLRYEETWCEPESE